MQPYAALEAEHEPSVLETFDAEGVLDALGVGIIVLDAQLCAIYANGIAQQRLCLQLREMRGRPLADFLPQPQRFAVAVRCVLDSGDTLEYALGGGLPHSSGETESFAVRIAPLRNQAMGAYVLIEWTGRWGGCA